MRSEPDSSNSTALLLTFWWSLAGTLLTFLALSHLLVMLCFLVKLAVSPFVAPSALLGSLAAGDWIARRENMRGGLRLALPAGVLSIVAVSLWLASSFFDMSWDGLWYHQTAVYQMAHGWNPLYDPMHSFVPHLQDWLRHYAKGAWYVELGLYAATGNIETAKAAPWIALVAAFSAMYAGAVSTGLGRWKGILIAASTALNPVVVFELASYLVDGLMISYLACFVASLLVWFRRPGTTVYWIMGASAVLCINAKFTGLVYLCFACAGAGLYILFRRRELLPRYLTLQATIVAAGVLLFGFNPYVTNTLNRHHPFYPILGTPEYPSLAGQGQDPIERWETPGNMVGRGRLVRLGYALFGRPGAQPYYPGNDASLMPPFDVGWNDFAIYYFHDVRISGFGPLFSGAFLIALILIAVSIVRPGIPWEVILLAAAMISASVLVSEHTWWARYGPQLWWIPMLGLVGGLTCRGGGGVRALTWGLAAVLIFDVVPISIVHFRWEAEATRITHEQLQLLHGRRGVRVDLQYFGEPFGERLKNGGVVFIRVDSLACAAPMELMSVSPGYPCAVRACLDN